MNPMPRRRRLEEGFTLIEIMVVILILGLLATIVVQSLKGATDKAKRTKAEADISEIKTALDRFYLDNGYYPTSDQGLTSLVTAPTGGRQPANYEEGGYIEKVPADPWGTCLHLNSLMFGVLTLWVDQHCDRSGRGYEQTQQLKPLTFKID